MKFCSANYADINKYYCGTFIKLTEFGDRLFFIEAVDRYKVAGKQDNKEDFVLWLDDNPEHAYQIDYVLPHKSFFQHMGLACQLIRIPAQQYQRGLSTKNTEVHYLKADGTRAKLTLDFDVLKSYVDKQQFATLNHAVTFKAPVATKSFVLSPRMMYNRGTKTIYMDFTPIAKVDKSEVGKHIIVMLVKIFTEDVKEMLATNNETHLFTIL